MNRHVISEIDRARIVALIEEGPSQGSLLIELVFGKIVDCKGVEMVLSHLSVLRSVWSFVHDSSLFETQDFETCDEVDQFLGGQ